MGIQNFNFEKISAKAWIIIGLGVLFFCTIISSFTVIPEGTRGIKTVFGKANSEALQPGLHFVLPFVSSVESFDVKEKKWERKTVGYTRDTQQVQVWYAAVLYPKTESVVVMYKKFGMDWESKIVQPLILSTIKDIIGQYIADDLVSKREAATAAISEALRIALEKRDIVLTGFSITNLDFNDDYEKAVEAKVVAIQHAIEAKNKTEQVKEESYQIVVASKAQAEAMRIKSEALAKNKGLTQYEAVLRWDGKLPTMMTGNSVPFINLKGE